MRARSSGRKVLAVRCLRPPVRPLRQASGGRSVLQPRAAGRTVQRKNPRPEAAAVTAPRQNGLRRQRMHTQGRCVDVAGTQCLHSRQRLSRGRKPWPGSRSPGCCLVGHCSGIQQVAQHAPSDASRENNRPALRRARLANCRPTAPAGCPSHRVRPAWRSRRAIGMRANALPGARTLAHSCAPVTFEAPRERRWPSPPERWRGEGEECTVRQPLEQPRLQ